MRPLVKLWRGNGIRCVVYIDDGLILASGIERAQQDSDFVRRSLETSGFVANVEKSHWDPQYKGHWLGFDLDLQQGHISVPTRKIENLREELGQNFVGVNPSQISSQRCWQTNINGAGLGAYCQIENTCHVYITE